MNFSSLLSRALILVFLSASIAHSITVKSATHSANLLSHTVREEYVFHIDKADSDREFDFLLSANQSQHLAYFQAWIGKGKGDLVSASQVVSLSHPRGELRRIDLSSAPLKSCMVRIEMSTVSIARPYPERIPQGAEHRYRYCGSAAILSPYAIGVQSTHFLVKDVKEFTKSLPAHIQSSDGLKFGPYKDLPPLASGYEVEILYINNFPNLRLDKLSRKATISHAYSSVMIEEKYDLTNESPKLLKEFSRIDYGHSSFHVGKVRPLEVIHVHLPKNAAFISYRDEVGNISTSHARPTAHDVFLELSPRYPLFGGWNCSFELSYFVPLADLLTSKQHVHTLTMPIFNLFNDVSATELIFEMVLPERARLVSASPAPLAGVSKTNVGSRIESSYLDTVGRHVYVLQAENVVKESCAKPFTMVYEYGFFDQLRKLLLVIAAYLLCFASLILYKKFSFDPFPSTAEKNSKKSP